MLRVLDSGCAGGCVSRWSVHGPEPYGGRFSSGSPVGLFGLLMVWCLDHGSAGIVKGAHMRR